MSNYLIEFIGMILAVAMWIPPVMFTLQTLDKMGDSEERTLAVFMKINKKNRRALRACYIIGSFIFWGVLAFTILKHFFNA